MSKVRIEGLVFKNLKPMVYKSLHLVKRGSSYTFNYKNLQKKRVLINISLVKKSWDEISGVMLKLVVYRENGENVDFVPFPCQKSVLTFRSISLNRLVFILLSRYHDLKPSNLH